MTSSSQKSRTLLELVGQGSPHRETDRGKVMEYASISTVCPHPPPPTDPVPRSHSISHRDEEEANIPSDLTHMLHEPSGWLTVPCSCSANAAVEMHRDASLKPHPSQDVASDRGKKRHWNAHHALLTE